MWIVTLKVIAQRFVELMFTSVVLSVIAVILNITGAIKIETALFLVLLLFSLLFMCLNIKLMRLCYFDLMDRTVHYVSNLAAYLLFAAVGYAVYFFCSSEVYSWMFEITKFAKYSSLGADTPVSALLFHVVGIVSVLVAPIGMRWVFLYGKEDEE